MSTHSSDMPSESTVHLVDECRFFSGAAPEFWQKFAKACCALSSARSVRMLVQLGDAWRVLSAHPEGKQPPLPMTEDRFKELQNAAFEDGYTYTQLPGLKGGFLFLAALQTEEGGNPAIAEFRLDDEPEGGWQALIGIIPLIVDTPRMYQRNRQMKAAQEKLDHYSKALDVLAVVNNQVRFIPAAMALVNEVAGRLGASRATLGWLAEPYIKVVAMSGTEKFERKVQAIQKLETAMEECRDQDEELVVPALPESDSVVRDHSQYVKDSGIAAVLSVPLRVDGEVVAVITVEREEDAFAMEDAAGLRVIADQTARRLDELKRSDRWFGARWTASARKVFEKALGPTHTWLKVGAVTGTLFLAFALLFPYTYRVESTFIVRPDSLAQLPVPFDGYIAEAHVRPGDLVEEGQLLVLMDQGELLVSEASALADIGRHRADAEGAEANRRLADFRVARVLEAQAQASLELARHRLNRSEIRSPFEGVVIEGDLRERLGAPVSQGDVLLQVSRLDGLYMNIQLPERDIDLLDDSGMGEAAFASRPDLRFPFKIERIEPAAVSGADGSHFVIRAELTENAEWLRPGMTGIAKLNGGKRTLAWRATHRIVDFFRMRFWL
ncbi:MAG: efflux RND transporter periplasmic adaptor subunit [Opitutales bacterium]|nr:efflux RND transporter periplasmic adaptor subunit [Opitutales bacterium]